MLYGPPKTGVFDSHQFMKAMLDDFERADGIAIYNQNLKKIFTKGMHLELLLDDSTKLITKNLINCCGLNATNFAQKIEGFPKKFIRIFIIRQVILNSYLWNKNLIYPQKQYFYHQKD